MEIETINEICGKCNKSKGKEETNCKCGRPLKFQSEKEFIDYLKLNADKWVFDFFGEKLKKILFNKSLIHKKFGPNTPRIDIVIETEKGTKIGIECKNPKHHFHELSRSLSQLLAYGVLAEENNNKFDILALISSERNDIVFKIIKRYNLPIRNFYVDREIHGEIK